MTTGALAALVFASFATALTVSGSLVADDAGATPKLYHLMLALIGVLVIVRGRVVLPPPEVLTYFATMMLMTGLTYVAFTPRVAGVKLLIAFYTTVAAAVVARGLSRMTLLRACRIGSAVFLAVVIVKNVLHIQSFVLWLASPLGHPDVPSLAGGGLNLEATWLAVSSAFFIGSVMFVPFVLGAAATSALYASRAGVLIAALIVIAALVKAVVERRSLAHPRMHSRARRLTWMLVTVAATVGVIIGRARVNEYGDTTYVARRFSTIGEEPGSMGRLTLWRGGLAVFTEFPLGVGAGNAVPTLRRVLGVDVPEDNLHNMYLQHAVEAGIPGLVALLALGVVVAVRVVKSRFRDPLLIFVAAYFVAGAIQFTGVDAALWLVYGLQWGSNAGGVDA
jgi:O-antigen ligase